MVLNVCTSMHILSLCGFYMFRNMCEKWRCKTCVPVHTVSLPVDLNTFENLRDKYIFRVYTWFIHLAPGVLGLVAYTVLPVAVGLELGLGGSCSLCIRKQIGPPLYGVL